MKGSGSCSLLLHKNKIICLKGWLQEEGGMQTFDLVVKGMPPNFRGRKHSVK